MNVGIVLGLWLVVLVGSLISVCLKQSVYSAGASEYMYHPDIWSNPAAVENNLEEKADRPTSAILHCQGVSGTGEPSESDFFLVGSCMNRKESSLIPTFRLENLADVSTECFSLQTFTLMKTEAFSQNVSKVF